LRASIQAFAKGGEAGLDGAFVIWIAPGAGAVIDADGGVFLDAAVEGFRRRKGDLAHGDADVLVDLALDIDAGGGGELLGGMGLRRRSLGSAIMSGKVLGSWFFVLGWGGLWP
jgi:hypothetical protein